MSCEFRDARVRWPLLRVWHLEAMDCALHSPQVWTFARTSYVSTPPYWQGFPAMELASRIEALLVAHYRLRAFSLRGAPGDQMVPFAFDFEWVAFDDHPAAPQASARPRLFPCAFAYPHLADVACVVLEAMHQAPRAGIAARCYGDAFDAFRVDEDDTWHRIKAPDRDAMFAARYG